MSLITTWSGKISSLKLFKTRKANSGTVLNKPSHISRLPPELLVLIFESICALYQTQEVFHITSSDYPLIISSVCRLWRNVALNVTPAIWSTIIFHPNRTLDLPLLYLGRSGDVLLNISIRFHFINTKKIKSAGIRNCLNLILQYSHRWRIVRFSGCEDFNYTSHALRSVRAPNLTVFYLDGSFTDKLSSIFEEDGAPMLSEITMNGMAKFCGQFSSFSSVQTLHLRYCGHEMNNAEFSSFLESFPSLKWLMLRGAGPRAIATQGDKPARLPNLAELTSFQDPNCPGLWALSLQVPLLRVVNLSVVDERIWNLFWELFVSYPKSLPSVERLAVSGTVIRVLQKVPAVFPNVRELNLCETLVKPVLASEELGFEQARYWASLEKLTIRGWSRESGDRYLIGFIKGLLEWYGFIQRIELVVNHGVSFTAAELEEELKELETRFEVIYAEGHDRRTTATFYRNLK